MAIPGEDNYQMEPVTVSGSGQANSGFNLASAIPFVGPVISAFSAASANRKAAREAASNRDFQERMSNTMMQRRVLDLKAAGLNPMLAYQQGGASSPSGNVAPVQDVGAVASGQMLAAVGMRAQIQNTQAQTRLTNAEAEIRENQVPYSGGMAKLTYDQAEANLRRTAEEVDNIIRSGQLMDKDINKLKDLLIRAQELQNKATELGMPAKQADANFWNTVDSSALMRAAEKYGIMDLVKGLFLRGPR